MGCYGQSMARPLRIEYPGALYHVTARGNDRRNIFLDARDHKHFLELLSAGIKEYEVLLHAYVLMTNHYHLVVRTQNPNLSKFMHFLNTALTVWANKRHRRTGHLFEGRYKAIVMQEEGYLLRVVGYVHMNPVRVRGWKSRSVQERFARLKTYAWSSYNDYAVARKKPRDPLVSSRIVYGKLGARTSREGRRRFREYLRGWLQEESLRQGGTPEDETYRNPLSETKLQTYMGDEEFRDMILGLMEGDEELSSEVVAHEEWTERPKPDEILARAIELLRVPKEPLRSRRRNDLTRSVLMYLCKDISKCGLRQVADLFRVTPAAVSMRLKNLRGRLLKDGPFRRKIKKAQNTLT